MSATETNPTVPEDVQAYSDADLEQGDAATASPAGAVDDGKSTLIGRLLHDSKSGLRGPTRRKRSAGARSSNRGDDDRLGSAHRWPVGRARAGHHDRRGLPLLHDRPKRKFIIADTPGHEQYTRNMVTGASTADVAMILVDARQRACSPNPGATLHRFVARHPHLVVIWPSTRWTSSTTMLRAVYERDLVADYAEFTRRSASTFEHVIAFIPLSALKGDNVIEPSRPTCDWYHGPTLMGSSGDGRDRRPSAARSRSAWPVQWVNRPNSSTSAGLRAGSSAGTIRQGDACTRVASGGKPGSTVERIVTMDGDLDVAVSPVRRSLITLADEVDVSRGDVLCVVARHDQAEVIRPVRRASSCGWTKSPMLHRSSAYLLKLGTAAEVGVTVSDPKYQIQHQQSRSVLEQPTRWDLNDIGRSTCRIDRNLIPFDPTGQPTGRAQSRTAGE